jgi:hypothetical protein
LIATALLTPAFGQSQGQDKNSNRFRPNAATAKMMQARAASVSIPDDNLPPIKGATIVVAGGVNGDPNRTVWLMVDNPQGQYYVRGVLADGDNTAVPLGMWEFDAPTESIDFEVMNGNPAQVFPTMSQLWEIEVLHFGAGLTEKLSALCGPYQDQSAGMDMQVGNDQFVNGTYMVSLGGNTSDTTAVSVGSYGLASEVNLSPMGGAVAVFPPGFSPDITVCKKTGWCYTDTFKPKGVPPPPSGKG